MRDPRIWVVPVASTPPVRTSPAGAHARGSTATPAAALLATCRHCGEKIRMNKGTDYWFHVRTQVEECGP